MGDWRYISTISDLGSRFLLRTLCISKHALSRLAYDLATSFFFTENIKGTNILQENIPYQTDR
jgi:hypothetical protein